MAAPYSYLHSSVYRLKEAVKGTGVYRYLAQLRKEEYLSPEGIKDLQAARLRKLLIRARDHSPYYRNLFSEHGLAIGNEIGLDWLAGVPLLRREDLQSKLNSILCDNAASPYLNSSGGSTGNPVNFYQDDFYVNYARAANLLFMDWMGIRSGDKTAVFWGADRDFKDQSLRFKMWQLFDRVRALNSFSMSDELIVDFLKGLDRFQPRYIQGYAGSLYFIARMINDSNPISFRPVAVRSSAETLFDFQRNEIEKAFGAPVYNFYGSREVNNLAAECSAHEGLHQFASGRIMEIVDEIGSPVRDGELGQIAVTDLTNFTFPFIRYLNGDVAIRRDRACSCGRGYPMVERICGRTTDMIVVDGKYIHGEFFTHLFYKRPDIRQFQVVQEREKSLKIIVAPRDAAVNIDDIIARIREKVGHTVDIETLFTDHIDATATGKYRFTISKVARKPQSEPHLDAAGNVGG